MNRNMRFLPFIFLYIFLLSNAYGQQNNLHEKVWVDEKLGQNIPLDLTFYDERGSVLKLSDIINKPTILTLVYYSCEHVCPQMLGALAHVIPKLGLVPGRDYTVITLSFDNNDTPATAYEKKINYIKAINSSVPEDAWKFLTGSSENIRKITEALGFTYIKEIHGFIHPVVLVVLSPDGKITRYIYVSKYHYGVAYPITFTPLDIATALTDASQGKVGTSVIRSILNCFPHEPSGQERFFNLLGIVGIATLILVVSLFIYLLVTTKKNRNERK